jgi:hypothetical protein
MPRLGVVLPRRRAALDGDPRASRVDRDRHPWTTRFGRRAAAHRLARARPAAARDPAAGARHPEHRARSALLGHALAAARLRDAVPYLADAEALFDERGDVIAEHADGSPRCRAWSSRRRAGVATSSCAGRCSASRCRAPSSRTANARGRSRWSRGLTEGELAARCVIGPGRSPRSPARPALCRGRGYARRVTTLEAAIGRRLSLRLGTFGTVVHRKSRFSELVLPDDVIDTLRDLIAMVRERSQILERWGYQRHLGISRGVSSLFSGEPGTGTLDLDRYLRTIEASGYSGHVGLEYIPTTTTIDSLRWLRQQKVMPL